MLKKKRSSALDYRKKNRRKVIKTIVQSAILLAVGVLLVNALFGIRKYEEPDKSRWSNGKGFIAISYFGVGRSSTPKLVAKSQLDQQLKALYNQGYVTISQQDVIDFYLYHKPLPDKALFLSFEDGRNDSSLFSQSLLEKYNYKATFFSYANKMGKSERKFVQPKEMLKMMKSGYWELGTNGNRLTYINIFDHNGRFIGMKDENELTNKEHIEYYNHFLMDFIRDENMIPAENRTEMETRIHSDYESMKDIYASKLGFVPQVYMIMHANALNNGMNPLVAHANSTNIEQMFSIHFNREGEALNTSAGDVLDLTRVQAAPYWYTNHLLMKIQKDTGEKMQFVHGDKQFADSWELTSGAAQFTDNRIILTSPPASPGMLYLKDSESNEDIAISYQLAGNVVGKQTVYIRYDKRTEAFLRVVVENNELYVEQKKSGGKEIDRVFSSRLQPISWSEEDLAFDKASVYTKEQIVADAGLKVEEYPINIQQTIQLKVELHGDLLTITVDGDPIADGKAIDGLVGSGGVALEAEYSTQNKKDDIYDAVFEDFEIALMAKEDSMSRVVYSHKITGFQGIIHGFKKGFDATINWVMDTF